MKTISEVMKFLRTNRGFSQEQAMPKGMTKYTYSKFENDKQSLKAEQIFEILENIQVRFEEFYSLLNEENYDIKMRKQLVQYITNLNKNKNKQRLIKMYRDLKNKENLTDIEYAILVDIKGIASGKVHEIDKIDKTDLKRIKSIIKDKKFFTYYDYKLVSNHIMNFNNKDINTFLKLMFPVKQLELRDTATKNVISQLFVNLITKELYSNNLEKADIYLDMGKNINSNFSNYYFALVFHYFKSIILFLKEGDLSHLDSATNIIKIIEEVGDKTTANEMRKELKLFIKNQKVPVQTGEYPTLILKDI